MLHRVEVRSSALVEEEALFQNMKKKKEAWNKNKNLAMNPDVTRNEE
jgi:hypothetical protein